MDERKDELITSKRDAEQVAAAESAEAQRMLAALGTVIEPLAQSQATAQRESTKRAEIAAQNARRLTYSGAVLGGMIIVLAGIALVMNKDQITEKVLIAVVSFVGGWGIGRHPQRT